MDDLKEMRGYWKLKEEAPSHSAENSQWKRLCTCREIDYGMNEFRRLAVPAFSSGKLLF
jgi:hypothetical protein